MPIDEQIVFSTQENLSLQSCVDKITEFDLLNYPFLSPDCQISLLKTQCPYHKLRVSLGRIGTLAHKNVVSLIKIQLSNFQFISMYYEVIPHNLRLLRIRDPGLARQLTPENLLKQLETLKDHLSQQGIPFQFSPDVVGISQDGIVKVYISVTALPENRQVYHSIPQYEESIKRTVNWWQAERAIIFAGVQTISSSLAQITRKNLCNREPKIRVLEPKQSMNEESLQFSNSSRQLSDERAVSPPSSLSRSHNRDNSPINYRNTLAPANYGRELRQSGSDMVRRFRDSLRSRKPICFDAIQKQSQTNQMQDIEARVKQSLQKARKAISILARAKSMQTFKLGK